MAKRSGFLILVLFIFLIFLIWMSVKHYTSSSFKLVDNNIYNMKQTLGNIWIDTANIYNNSSLTNNIKSAIQNELDQKNKDLSQTIEIGIKKQIQELKTDYIYEPWNIKISYFSDAQKFFDEKLQKIIIKYSDTNFLEIKKETFKEKQFNDWLVKHFDIQKLSKQTINNLIFWSNEENKDSVLIKTYIVNIDKNIYYLIYHCETNSIYCDKLNQTAISFEQNK